jgi:hypothetical protein
VGQGDIIRLGRAKIKIVEFNNGLREETVNEHDIHHQLYYYQNEELP